MTEEYLPEEDLSPEKPKIDLDPENQTDEDFFDAVWIGADVIYSEVREDGQVTQGIDRAIAYESPGEAGSNTRSLIRIFATGRDDLLEPSFHKLILLHSKEEAGLLVGSESEVQFMWIPEDDKEKISFSSRDKEGNTTRVYRVMTGEVITHNTFDIESKKRLANFFQWIGTARTEDENQMWKPTQDFPIETSID